MDISEIPRPKWDPLPREGCTGVAGRVLLRSERLGLAMLRFEPEGTIDLHTASIDVDVICLEGSGFVSVGDEQEVFSAGHRVHWPRGVAHRLWTEGETMVTLMAEHFAIDE